MKNFFTKFVTIILCCYTIISCSNPTNNTANSPTIKNPKSNKIAQPNSTKISLQAEELRMYYADFQSNKIDSISFVNSEKNLNYKIIANDGINTYIANQKQSTIKLKNQKAQKFCFSVDIPGNMNRYEFFNDSIPFLIAIENENSRQIAFSDIIFYSDGKIINNSIKIQSSKTNENIDDKILKLYTNQLSGKLINRKIYMKNPKMFLTHPSLLLPYPHIFLPT